MCNALDFSTRFEFKRTLLDGKLPTKPDVAMLLKFFPVVLVYFQILKSRDGLAGNPEFFPSRLVLNLREQCTDPEFPKLRRARPQRIVGRAGDGNTLAGALAQRKVADFL